MKTIRVSAGESWSDFGSWKIICDCYLIFKKKKLVKIFLYKWYFYFISNYRYVFHIIAESKLYEHVITKN